MADLVIVVRGSRGKKSTEGQSTEYQFDIVSDATRYAVQRLIDKNGIMMDTVGSKLARHNARLLAERLGVPHL